jgi:hypothetical protein
MTSIISEQTTLLPPSPPTIVEQGVNSIQLINQDIVEQNNVESPPQAHLPVRENIEQEPIVEQEPAYINIIPGKFEYIADVYERLMLSNAWQAITMTETWNFVREPIESFMMSNDNRIWIITAKMGELGYNGHSGCSFGWTMRQMQYIARNGEENYKKSRE